MPSDQRETKMYDTVKKSDTTLLEYPVLSKNRILQGVTTEIGGNCGGCQNSSTGRARSRKKRCSVLMSVT